MATLTEDIQAIRKYKKISLNDLYDKTKVPAHIIEMIDNGTIFSENSANKTYIRSFIRTYVKGLGITDEDIIQALDDQELDTYDGFLVEKYMREIPKEPRGPIQKTDSHATDKKAAKKSALLDNDFHDEEPDEVAQEPKKVRKASPKKISTKKSTKVEEKNLDEEDEIIRQTKSTHTAGSQSVDIRPDATKPYNARTPQPADLDSIDWSNTVQRFNPLKSKSNIYAVSASVICVILIIALGAYAYQSGMFSGYGSGVATANLDEAVQLPISADTDNMLNETEQVQPIAALPDTLEIIIHASNDKLEPVRVRSDFNNILSPYWVEQGDIHRSRFIDELLIRGQYSRMTLIYNGHEIEDITNLTTQDQFIRITRDFLDADPKFKNKGPITFPDDPQQTDTTNEVAE